MYPYFIRSVVSQQYYLITMSLSNANKYFKITLYRFPWVMDYPHQAVCHYLLYCQHFIRNLQDFASLD